MAAYATLFVLEFGLMQVVSFVQIFTFQPPSQKSKSNSTSLELAHSPDKTSSLSAS
jgi:hypothetical protein